MFKPETEDMLPRPAPKPIAQMELSDGMVKPTVPEVSILLGQQEMAATSKADPNTAQLQQKPKQSYASWKQQVLPKVSFPPPGAEVTDYMPNPASYSGHTSPECIVTRSSVYPLRTVPVNISPLAITNTNAAIYASSNDLPSYRRSMDSVNMPAYTMAPMDNGYAGFNGPYNRVVMQRRSIDAINPYDTPKSTRSAAEVLTICASTQTEAMLPVSPPTHETLSQVLQNFATKRDFEQVLDTMQTIREQQQRLLQVFEAFLVHQQQEYLSNAPKGAYYCDVGTQYENLESLNGQCTQPAQPRLKAGDDGGMNAKQPVQAQPYFQPPVAQSTTYRPNSPHAPRNVLAAQQQTNTQGNMVKGLPKPSTEKSLVMNELALKYLPNEKLNELLQDMHIATPQQQQQHQQQQHQQQQHQQQHHQQQQQQFANMLNKENINLSPNNISNASYKYLKKYRLLPEENAAFQLQQQAQPPPVRNAMSPLVPHNVPPSPLVPHNVPPSPASEEHDIFDFEHIRRQPKLM